MNNGNFGAISHNHLFKWDTNITDVLFFINIPKCRIASAQGSTGMATWNLVPEMSDLQSDDDNDDDFG